VKEPKYVMKIKLLLPILALFAAAGCAGAPAAKEFSGTQTFKNVKWGMSRDKAEVIIDRDLKAIDAMKYYAGDQIFGMPCKVTYDFGLKNRLRSIIVEFDVMNQDAEYYYVIKKISEEYGPPQKNSPKTGVIWYTPDTVIGLVIIGGDEKQMKLSFIMKEKT
jgi:hypothetical protein